MLLAGRTMRRCGMALTALAITLTAGIGEASDSSGQEPLVVRESVGSGIHAYHEGDFNRAYDDLTNAIEAGTTDPRSYYFRGLAALKLGRTSEAEADFATGADREVVGGSSRRVSLSLERVQGPDRLTLERFRSRARLVAVQRDRDAYGRRYSEIEDPTSDVRRRRRPENIQPELVVPPAAAEELPPATADAEDDSTPTRGDKPARPGKTFQDEPAEEADDPSGDAPATSVDGKKAVETEDAE